MCGVSGVVCVFGAYNATSGDRTKCREPSYTGEDFLGTIRVFFLTEPSVRTR